MKRRIRKWTYALYTLLILTLAFSAFYMFTIATPNAYPNQNKKHAMLRLEDIGPGGEYTTPDGLGKLRAIVEELHAEGIPYQVAVIPRWVDVGKDGSWLNRGIDDAKPDAYMDSFIRLLQMMEQQGGVLGMHGYTHQYGNVVRKDVNEISGQGVEFKVPGAEETYTADYAADRITRSLQAFRTSGLHPAFWESPHYTDTRQQEKALRSFMGIIYEPDYFSVRSLKDVNVYESMNTYGQNSKGSIYVPAPLGYMQNGTSVDRLLRQSAGYTGLASFYFHPFLEFAQLEAVRDAEGQPEVRDGLPVYHYKTSGPSLLHRLVSGLKDQGYQFISLHEAIPFSPAHELVLPAGISQEDWLLGDVTGDGQADVLLRYPDRIELIECSWQWPRNRAQPAPAMWLQHASSAEEQLSLADLNGDHRQDLVIYSSSSGLLQVSYAGERGGSAPGTLGTLPKGLKALRLIPQRVSSVPALTAASGSGAGSDSNSATEWLALQDQSLLHITLSGSAVTWKDTGITLAANDTFELTDLNHDGNADLVVIGGQPGKLTDAWSAGSGIDSGNRDATGSLWIYPRSSNGDFKAAIPIELSAFAKHKQLLLDDTDGDGRTDIIACDTAKGVWQVYRNEGDFSFKPMDNAYGPWARGKERIALSADFDGNGKADIASYDPKSRVIDLSLSFQP